MSGTVVRLFGRLDKLLMVGLLCMTASGLAIVTQLGGTRATALSIPHDAYARPYTDSPSSPPVSVFHRDQSCFNSSLKDRMYGCNQFLLRDHRLKPWQSTKDEP